MDCIRASNSVNSMDSLRTRDSPAAQPWFHASISREITEKYEHITYYSSESSSRLALLFSIHIIQNMHFIAFFKMKPGLEVKLLVQLDVLYVHRIFRIKKHTYFWSLITCVLLLDYSMGREMAPF